MLYLAAVALLIAMILHSGYIHFTYDGKLTDEDGNQLFTDKEGTTPARGPVPVEWGPWVMMLIAFALIMVICSL